MSSMPSQKLLGMPAALNRDSSLLSNKGNLVSPDLGPCWANYWGLVITHSIFLVPLPKHYSSSLSKVWQKPWTIYALQLLLCYINIRSRARPWECSSNQLKQMAIEPSRGHAPLIFIYLAGSRMSLFCFMCKTFLPGQFSGAPNDISQNEIKVSRTVIYSWNTSSKCYRYLPHRPLSLNLSCHPR